MNCLSSFREFKEDCWNRPKLKSGSTTPVKLPVIKIEKDEKNLEIFKGKNEKISSQQTLVTRTLVKVKDFTDKVFKEVQKKVENDDLFGKNRFKLVISVDSPNFSKLRHSKKSVSRKRILHPVKKQVRIIQDPPLKFTKEYREKNYDLLNRVISPWLYQSPHNLSIFS